MKTFLMSILLVASPAFAIGAGPSTGGGGFALDCRATVLEPARVELLDLYEGTNVLGFEMAESSGDLTEDYFQSVKRVYTLQGFPNLADELRVSIILNVKNFFRRVNELETVDQLPHTSDLGPLPELLPNCELRQVAFYNDKTGGVDVLMPLFKRMNSLSQAALINHELTYRDYRDLGDRTSVFARRATSHAFAIGGNLSPQDGLTSQSVGFSVVPNDLKTVAPNTLSTFMLTPESGGQLLKLQFLQLAGRAQLTKTWAEFPAIPWNFHFGRSKTNPQFVGCILKTPDQDIKDLIVPVHGTMLEGLSLRYNFKTDEPIQIEVLNVDGKVQASGFVSDYASCSSASLSP